MASVQARLRAAELARVEAEAKAAEERKRRRLTVALAGSVMITSGIVGGGWAYLTRQRLEREAVFNQVLSEADALFGEARRVGDDTALWLTAHEATRAIERLLAYAPDKATRAHAVMLVREAAQAAAAAENDQRLLSRLVRIRSAVADDPDGRVAGAEFGDAFLEAGIDLESLPPAESGAMIRARPSVARISLASAIDYWAAIRHGLQHNRAGALRLTEVARMADPDPWRNRLRDLFEASERQDQAIRLKELATSARIEELPAVSIYLLGATLLHVGNAAEAAAVLRHGQLLHPEDFWLNNTLARCLERLGRVDEAIRYHIAARSLQPESAHDLGHALAEKGETDEAIDVFRNLTELRPSEGRHFACLASVLKSRRRTEEAKTAVDAAVALFRAAIRAKPESPTPHAHLGTALGEQGKVVEAIAELRQAVRLQPDFFLARYGLGRLLHRQGTLNEAITEIRAALRLKPDSFEAHNGLGISLKAQGKLDEAIIEYREALRLKPDSFEAHNNLGLALEDQRKLVEALDELRAAVRLKPENHDCHRNLGSILTEQGKLVEAIAELLEAVRLEPGDHKAHQNLGLALKDQGRLVEAIAELREAVRLAPDDDKAHNNLGVALKDQGSLDAADAEFRTALRLNSKLAEAHDNLGVSLAMRGKIEDATTELRVAQRLSPDNAAIRYNLGLSLEKQGNYVAAIAEYRQALRIKPDKLDAHQNLGSALIHAGKPKEAIVALREAVRLKPDFAMGHYNLGMLFTGQGSLDLAIAAYRDALRYKPDYAEAQCNLGHVLSRQGRYAEALAELKRGHELGSNNPNWHYPSAEWVRNAERQVELDAKLPTFLRGQAKPVDHLESLGFAQLCYQKKLHGASARFWTDAFQAQPKLAEDLNVPNRYNAACAAALAGSGQGKDDPPLDEEKKTHWRKQAIDWLKADLTAWSKILESGSHQARQAITQTLQHWKADADLAGLRNAPALTKLPDDEQKACGALWAEVDALLAESRGTDTKSDH